MDRTVRAVVADALPAATVTSVETPTTGNTKRTVFVSLADGRELVIQSRPTGEGLSTEARLAREVARRTDVPVPRVLAAGTVEGVDYVLAERASGEDLHTRFVGLDPADRQAVVRAMGRWLADLHAAFEFEGYGPVTLDGDRLVVADPATGWRAWFRDHVERRLYRVAAVVSAAVDSRGRVTRPRYPELDDDAAVEFHRRHLRSTLDGETHV